MAEFVRKISKDAILDENLKNVYRYVEEKVSSNEGQLLKETVPAFILASKVLYIINEFDQMLKVIAQVLRILSLN